MKRNVILLTALFIFFSLAVIFPKTIINTGRVVKIGNEVILKSDIEKYSKDFNVSYDEAKKIIIDNSILYTGATMYAEEPTEEEVSKKIKKEKEYLASLYGKDIKSISDEEFLMNLNYSKISMNTYRENIKMMLWINRYVDENFNNKNVEKFESNPKDIKKLIKEKPDLFEEQAGVILSMIYFSFYSDRGIYKTKNMINETYERSRDCLIEYQAGKRFEELVEKYSEDLISKNNTPKGRVGFIAFDDPRAVSSFSLKIINILKKKNTGVVSEVLETKNGLYIFRIDEKKKAIKLDEEEAKLKAETYLGNRYIENEKDKVKKELIDILKDKIIIEYY